jgi:ABC-type transport system involved in cytochrome c biogenesis permease subunit
LKTALLSILTSLYLMKGGFPPPPLFSHMSRIVYAMLSLVTFCFAIARSQQGMKINSLSFFLRL